MEISLPIPIQEVINRLNGAGFDAFLVGGSIRDYLLGKQPHDFDIATSALPAEILNLFFDEKAIETGIKHGTVTLIYQKIPIEITTFRTEGTYSDYRHPDKVIFTKSIKEDLARRDFTVNAFAYHPKTGVLDFFEGQKDLSNRIIRAVGDPLERMSEDPLRIIRALRFASILDGIVEPSLESVLHEQKSLLANIAIERIREEFMKLIVGPGVGRILRAYFDVIGQFIPEILPMVGLSQDNPYHCYDVWEHTLHALEATTPEAILRLTMLLHDIGKPVTISHDEKGIGHFYGHVEKGVQMAEEILKRMKYDRKTIDLVTRLIAYHDRPFGHTESSRKRFLSEVTWSIMEPLLKVKRADIMAQSERFRERLYVLDEVELQMQHWINEGTPFHRSQLAINGNDIQNLGIEGPRIKEVLESLIEAVHDHEVENTSESLLAYIKKLQSK